MPEPKKQEDIEAEKDTELEDEDLELDDEDIDLGDDDELNLEEDEDEPSEGQSQKDEDEDGDQSVYDLTEDDLEKPENRKKALEALRKNRSAVSQKKKWREKYQNAMKGEQKKPAQKEASKKTPAGKQVESDALARQLERNEFRLDHPDIPRRLVDQVQKYAIANNISLERAYKAPIVRALVNNKKLRERLANASPSSAHRSPPSKPAIDWRTATPEQVKAHEAELRQKRLSAR